MESEENNLRQTIAIASACAKYFLCTNEQVSSHPIFLYRKIDLETHFLHAQIISIFSHQEVHFNKLKYLFELCTCILYCKRL